MREDWSNSEFAIKWDRVISTGHPTRAEQLDILTEVLADNYRAENFVLDIGCGSGQVEELLFRKRSDLKIIGIDSSEPMFRLAKQRLQRFGDSFRFIPGNISDFDWSLLPKGHYQFAFAVQVVHEIAEIARRNLFTQIYKLLEPGGTFLILDRVKVDMSAFQQAYRSVWGRLEKTTEFRSGRTYSDYHDSILQKQDFPGTLDEYSKALSSAGFDVAVLHAHFDRALIMGVKAKTHRSLN